MNDSLWRRIATHTGCVLLLITLVCASRANADTILSGLYDSGTITISAGETAWLSGTLTGNVQLLNYGTLLTDGAGRVMGNARIENFGNIGNLGLLENARLSNSSSGSVGNLIMSGGIVVNAGAGFINNMTLTGVARRRIIPL